MKKAVIAVAGCLVAATCAAAFSGCNLFGSKEDETYYEVSTVSELKAMESEKNYKLTADIDLDDAVWTPVNVKSFDGQNHTISNANVTGSEYAGIFGKVSNLKNVTFTDIDVTVKSYSGATAYLGIAAGYISYDGENITVKDSSASITVSYSQTYGYELSQEYIYGGAVAAFGGNLKNCHAEDCDVSATSNTYNRLELGGLGGYFFYKIEDCTAKKVTINGKSKSSGNYGGLMGTCSTLKNCVASNCNIQAACTDSKNVSRVGGLVGHVASNNEGIVDNCASIKNTIKFAGYEQYTVGGFAGKSEAEIGNCLSSGNSITAYFTNATSSSSRYAGAFAGSVTKTVSNSVAMNNRVSSTETASDVVALSGFAAYAEASVVKCGTRGNTLLGVNQCEFAKDGSYVKNCVAYAGSGDDGWESVIETLSLDENLWTMTGGVLSLKVAG